MENKHNIYLICPGAQKAGTSFLANVLIQHPQICFSQYKETHYYCVQKQYEKGIKGYLNLFSPDENSKYLADFTPEYLPRLESIKRIKEQLGENVKFIVLLREPVKRAFSQYNMRVSKGRCKKSFEQLVNENLNEGKERMVSIVNRGLYAEQLDNLMKYYKKEDVLIVTFEKLVREKDIIIKNILDFLQIQNDYNFSYEVDLNERRYTKAVGLGKLAYRVPLSFRRRLYKMSSLLEKLVRKILSISVKEMETKSILTKEIKSVLKEYYHDSNQRLKKEYGVDVSDWEK